MTTPNSHLYKFMAFFGLLLFLTCVLFPYLKFDDNNKQMNEIRRNLLVLNHERDALVNEIKLIEEAQVTAADDAGTINGRIAEIRKGVDLRTEQISLENQILEELSAKQGDIRLFMGYFIILSILISISGFVLWYLKVQRPLNRFIKLEFLKHIEKD